MEKRSALVAFLCGSVCHAFNVGNVVANHQGAPGVSFIIKIHRQNYYDKNSLNPCLSFQIIFSPYLATQ